MESTAIKKRVIRRKKSLSFELKTKLCELVRMRPVLWQKSNASFKKNDVRKSAWTEISDLMSIPGDELKKQWNSFREQHRYMLGKKRAQPSGASDEDPDIVTDEGGNEPAIITCWDLWPHYKFVFEQNGLRKTNSSLQISDIHQSNNDVLNQDTYEDEVFDDSNLVNDADNVHTDQIHDSVEASVFESSSTCNATSDDNIGASNKVSNNSKKRLQKRSSDYTYMSKQAKPDAVGDSIVSALAQMTKMLESRQGANSQQQQSPIFHALSFLEAQLLQLPALKQQQMLKQFMEMAFDAVMQHQLLNTQI